MDATRVMEALVTLVMEATWVFEAMLSTRACALRLLILCLPPSHAVGHTRLAAAMECCLAAVHDLRSLAEETSANIQQEMLEQMLEVML